MPNKSRKSDSPDLNKDKDIQRWFDNVARGSSITADVYLRRLKASCQKIGTSPQKLIKMDEEDLYNTLLDFVGTEEKRGMTGSYIQSSLKAIRSWLSFKRIKIPGKIRVKGAHQTPTLENERVPTQEELRKIFLNSTPKDRVSCVFMAHSGLRPEVLGNYKGDDGLRIKDLPEMKILGDEVSFDKIPTMVVVRPELSKTSNRYFTFLSKEGCDYIKEYLEARLRKGEKLNLNSDLIHPVKAKKQFIRSLNIGDGVRKSLRASGFPWRPYVLRAYFDTQLLLAESKGKMTHSYRQFFMGHKGDMEARYTVNKGRLTTEMIEDMRESYRKSQSFLQTSSSHNDEDDFDLKFITRMLRLSRMSEGEIEALDFESMSNEEIWDLLQKRLIGKSPTNGNNQKVVLMNDIEGYIEEGWEYVNSLPGDKVIIRIPH